MTRTEKLAQSVWLIVIARASMLAMPVVASFCTWLFWQVYVSISATQAQQAQAIVEIQKALQDHEFRLKSGRDARLEFQNQTFQQFDRFDDKLQLITDKLGLVNDAVIRVQTIVETRLPPRAAERDGSWSRQ